MSLLPPNSIVQSKCFHYLKKNLEPSLFEEVIHKLPPFPQFRLKCVFRNIEAVETIEFSDTEIIGFIAQTEEYSKMNLWDCSDIALNMFVRMKKPAVESLSGKKGVVTFLIQSGNDDKFSDIYLDEVILKNKDNIL
jgi:hypothetical protein